MKLYHGTDEKTARQALACGLRPRADTGVKSTWEEVPSRPDMIYFTNAYALYFALMAAEPGEKLGIVEVDTDLMEESLFHPDEDFLEQATRGREDLVPIEYSMELRTKIYQAELESYQPHWKLSLEGLGNCSYLGQVVPSEVTRVVLFDPAKSPTFRMMALDPQISLFNYAMLGGTKYRALMAWLFNEPVEVVEFDPMFGIEEWPEGYPEDLLKHVQDRRTQMQAAVDDRSACEMLLPEVAVGV